MKYQESTIDISDIFQGSDPESVEARNNLLGFFEVLIEIDRRLKKEDLVKSKNKEHN